MTVYSIYSQLSPVSVSCFLHLQPKDVHAVVTRDILQKNMAKSRRMRWTGTVACMRRAVYRILAGKSESRGPIGRPRHMWEGNIQMDLGELGWSGMDWILVAQDKNMWRALVNTIMNLQVP
jgi:hypothetical protein